MKKEPEKSKKKSNSNSKQKKNIIESKQKSDHYNHEKLSYHQYSSTKLSNAESYQINEGNNELKSFK